MISNQITLFYSNKVGNFNQPKSYNLDRSNEKVQDKIEVVAREIFNQVYKLSMSTPSISLAFTTSRNLTVSTEQSAISAKIQSFHKRKLTKTQNVDKIKQNLTQNESVKPVNNSFEDQKRNETRTNNEYLDMFESSRKSNSSSTNQNPDTPNFVSNDLKSKNNSMEIFNLLEKLSIFGDILELLNHYIKFLLADMDSSEGNLANLELSISLLNNKTTKRVKTNGKTLNKKMQSDFSLDIFKHPIVEEPVQIG